MGQKKHPYIVGLILVLAILACNAPAASTDDAASVAQPTEVIVEQAEEPTPESAEPAPTEAPVDPATVCPEPTADTLLYIDEVNGFCLLYPDSFTPETYLDNAYYNAIIKKTVNDEEVTYPPVLYINVIANPGVAVGFTADDYLNRVVYGSGLPEFVIREEITLPGDIPAVELREQPAMIPYRALYVVVHNTLYEVTSHPDYDADKEPIPGVELVWTTMLDSLTFFPPTYSGEVLTTEDVCPAATADTYQLINRKDGYCVLVPNSFEEDPEYGMGWFIGGPELTGLPMGSRLSAVIGMSGSTTETVEQIADRHIDAVPDKDSVIRTDTTVSGYPAVFWERPQGTIPSRNALIVANGYQYSLVVQPVDPVNYPEAVEPAELAWNTFIDSFAFFEPWQ